MTRNAQDIIDDMRNIVKQRIAEMLLKANFEGRGKEDKAEFETEFEMIITLAEKALEQESVLDKIRAEIDEAEIGEYIRDPACFRAGLNRALNIIDKYKAESEDKE